MFAPRLRPLALGLAAAALAQAVDARAQVSVTPPDLRTTQDRSGAQDDAAPERTPEDLLRAWEGLTPDLRRDAAQWFIAECDRSTTFRSVLERYVMDRLEGPRFEHPAATETPTYDPAVHAPAQVIPRRFVDIEKAPFDRQYDRLRAGLVEHEFVAAYLYDWGRGEVVSTGVAWDDPERVARNAVRGFTPYTDLVEALVAETLDGDAMRGHAEAFAHAYADRNGNAFREVTLYDAWSSGVALEMPDVEVLGIVHDLDDDWKTYVAPVPPTRHKRLYAQIADHFQRYSRYRGIREALSRTYLMARPDLPRAYATARERLHGYWEEVSSDPAARAEDLPGPGEWADWLEGKAETVDRKPEIVSGRRGRQAALQESDAWAVRTFEGILRELGAFDPKPEPEPDPDGGGGDPGAR